MSSTVVGGHGAMRVEDGQVVQKLVSLMSRGRSGADSRGASTGLERWCVCCVLSSTAKHTHESLSCPDWYGACICRRRRKAQQGHHIINCLQTGTCSFVSLGICCGAMCMSAWDCVERVILTSGTACILSALAHNKKILIAAGSAWSSRSRTHRTKTPAFYMCPVCEGVAVYFLEAAIITPPCFTHR
jgi:hypothetical protein